MFIAVAGGSASGKSFFAQYLHQSLSREFPALSVDVVVEDSYYKPQSHLSIDERAVLNFDHPNAIDGQLLIEQMHKLKQKNTIERPVYSYKTHDRVGTQTVNSADIVIIEGLHLLGRQGLADLLDMKIFVNTPLDICLMRRIVRDTQERDRTLESILKQYQQFVRPMFVEHIEPTLNNADIILDGTMPCEQMWQKVYQSSLYKSLSYQLG